MKRYPAYKDSGVEWFEKLPSSWGLKKLKHISEVINGSTPKSGIEEYWNGDIVWITPNDLGHSNGSTVKDSFKQITTQGLNSCGTTLTPPGSIILSTRAPIGHIAMTSVETCTNQGCKTVVPNNEGCYNRFLFYYLISSKLNLQSLGQGSTFTELSSQNFKDFKSPFPSNEEQETIASYLDHKTHLIDTLIEKKQKQIELLQEQRAAIINQAVTKGLNTNVKMKDSGIEWLGDVPDHWGLLRLGRVITLQRGVDITKDEQVEGSVPVISSGGIKSYHNKAIQKGPGVIAGRKGTVGSVYFSECDYWPHDTTLYVKNFYGNYPKFVYYKLVSMKLENFDTGSANPTLNRNIIHPEVVAWPPKNEQKEISNYLDNSSTKTDHLISKYQSTINLLLEYRITLISEVVTGKIDVREEAVP